MRKLNRFKQEAAEFARIHFADCPETCSAHVLRQFRMLISQAEFTPLVSNDTENGLTAASMADLHNTASICDINCAADCDQCPRWSIEPEIVEFMAEVEPGRYHQLKWVWEAWRNATGPKIRPYFVNLSINAAENAKLSGFADQGARWRYWYESDVSRPGYDLRTVTSKLLKEIFPLYQQLHAYTRRKLKNLFPGEFDNSTTIPAHILGDVWAQEWTGIGEHLRPFPDEPKLDLNRAMRRQGFTVKKMFKVSIFIIA